MTLITTERLKFDLWNEKDLPAALALWGDPAVTQYIDARGSLNEAQVRQKLQDEIDRQNQFGVQYWKVSLKANGDVIGCCGLRPYQLEERVYEIGFHLKRLFWGQGFASEAAKAVISYAFDEMKISKLFAGHNPKNTASAGLLKKLGFQYIGDEFYKPTGLYHPSYQMAASERP